MDTRRNLRSLLAISFLAGLAVAATTAARTIYVDDDGPADFNTIQAAINDANDGDVIVVKPGRYTGDGNRDIDFRGKAITVCSTDPKDPNIVAGTVIDCNGTEVDPHRGFYFHSGEGPDAILAGMTVINGYGPYKALPKYLRSVGGAIYLEGSSPTIRHCLITGNSTDWYGGAIYCVSSSPTIARCTISGNCSKNRDGGAIYCRDSSPNIANCTITNNSADGSGGAIYSSGSNPQILNCSIRMNSALHGGGVACYEGSPMISHCKIMGNSATSWGGGITCRYCVRMSLDNCLAAANVARVGGGIYVEHASAVITHCTIADNSAEFGGGIGCAVPQNMVTLSHCILWGNSNTQIALPRSSEPSYLTILYSDIQGGQANVSAEYGWVLSWGNSNIDIDPHFVDASRDDYRLSAHSPCIDAGDPAYDVLPEETDIDDEPRLLGVRVDMGADESSSITESPVIGFSPARFVLHSYKGGPKPEDQAIFIRNTGIGILKWQIAEDCPWIELGLDSGESVDEIDEIALSFNTSGFPIGSYLCELRITAEGASNRQQVVPVNIYIADIELHVPSEYPTIQAAVDAALTDGQIIVVADGVYTGEGNRRSRHIDFKGKAITVRSEGGPENCIIDRENSGGGFCFQSGEDANSIINGFTITNASWGGVYCRKSSPTISNCIISNSSGGISCGDSSCPTITNCTIIGNTASAGGGIACWDGSNATIDNCAIIGNLGVDAAGGIWCKDSNVTLTRCTVIGNVGWQSGGGVSCQEATLKATNCTFAGNSARKGNFLACVFVHDHRSYVYVSNCIIRNGGDEIWNGSESAITIGYSDVEGGWPGEGNIDAEPSFADPGYWEPYEPNHGPPSLVDYFWVEGDYHLKSQAGRWDPSSQTWVRDDVTSPCIDAADPMNPIGLEPFPNGGIVNMGAYGGTAEASKSYFGEPPCEIIIAGDINGDCRVNFKDFQLMSFHWLEHR